MEAQSYLTAEPFEFVYGMARRYCEIISNIKETETKRGAGETCIVNYAFFQTAIQTPASSCKQAKITLTHLPDRISSNFAPKSPPATTPSAAGMSTEKS